MDEHHTVEDVAIALGTALDRALGDRAGIVRYGDARAPLDEALCHATVDLGGRGHAAVDLPLRDVRVGGLPASLVPHFVDSLSRSGTDGDPPARARGRRPPPGRGGLQGAGAGAAPGGRGRPRPGRVAAEHEGRDLTEVTLIDYGAGNLRSLRAAFERLGATVHVSGDPAAVAGAERLVLPGVGAAAPAMTALRGRGLDRAVAASTAPLMGVCLGMQLLFGHSDEGDVDCLGLLAGNVIAIDWAERVPHMGWNDVVGDGPPAVCYFAHSFAVDCDDRLVAARTSIDGREVPTVVRSGRLSGVQFHPEKSASDGRRVLERWLAA